MLLTNALFGPAHIIQIIVSIALIVLLSISAQKIEFKKCCKYSNRSSSFNGERYVYLNICFLISFSYASGLLVSRNIYPLFSFRKDDSNAFLTNRLMLWPVKNESASSNKIMSFAFTFDQIFLILPEMTLVFSPSISEYEIRCTWRWSLFAM